jgi:hypothetical protein
LEKASKQGRVGGRPRVVVDHDRLAQLDEEGWTPAMEDRLNTVIATPAVLAALGAVGHQLIDLPAGRAPRQNR